MNKDKSITHENAQLKIRNKALEARVERLTELGKHREQDLQIVLLAFQAHLIATGVSKEDVSKNISELCTKVIEDLKYEDKEETAQDTDK